MYISRIKINKYKILENIEIVFKIPKDNQNTINLIAGTNGSGKTSLLRLILDVFSYNFHIKEMSGSDFAIDFLSEYTIEFNGDISKPPILRKYPGTFENFSDLIKQYKTTNEYQNGIHSSPRIIYVPNVVSNQYQIVNNLNTNYSFINKIDPATILGNAELYIKDYVISKERESIEGDPIKRKKQAIDSFNNIFEDSDLLTKLSDLDSYDNLRPVFETINKIKITIDKLSDGEKQLYARVVSLMLLNPHNSIILIDEPEMSLHPRWQYAIMDIYKKIGSKNQLIIATHSPYIISKSHYDELIILKRENNKIAVQNLHNPPISRDINNILVEIMGAEHTPIEIGRMHKAYRKLIEEGKKDSIEAQELKAKLLERESSESEFMQSIGIYEDLKENF